MFSINKDNLSDARANDGMVGVEELEIVPHIQEDEFEHEKINEEGDEMDDREELSAVIAVAPPVVNEEWDDGIDGENDECDSDFNENEGSESEGSGSDGNDKNES
ncbi:hypothetical protein YC2023_050703 [Brassica napus]